MNICSFPHHRAAAAVLLVLFLFCMLSACTHSSGMQAEAVSVSLSDAVTQPTTAALTADTALSERVEPPQTTAIPESSAVTEETVTAAVSVTSDAVTDAVTAAPPAASSDYVEIPRLSTKTISDAKAILNGAGLVFSVTEEYSVKYDAGVVMTVRFRGSLDGDICRVSAAYPVEVVVSLGTRPIVNAAAPDAKRIYLTFDDGPHPNTDRVLEILDAYGVKATFFTLGMYAAVYPERISAIDAGGHLLACHSYSHDYMTLYESAESVLDEIASWERAVEKAGVSVPETVCFRFPGGSTTSYMDESRFQEIFWALTDAGYRAMDWTFSNNDRNPGGKADGQTLEDYLRQSTISSLANACGNEAWPKIMLLHDTADETVENLPWIIEYLQGEGYTFGTLDEIDGYWVFPWRQ